MVTQRMTALLSTAIVVLLAAQAAAQTPAVFADLARRLDVGDRVRVVDHDGIRLDGTVQSVSSDTLVVVGPAGPTAFTPATTARVATSGDSVLTGGLVGFIPGFLLGQQVPDAISEQREPASAGLKAGLITGAIGAAIGMAIDAARDGWTEVFVAEPRPRASLGPVVARDRIGAVAAFSW